MKRILFALAMVASVTAMAVDVETIVDNKFSTPGSVKPAFEKVDRNTAALKVAVEAVKVTSDAAQPADSDLTDLADGSLTGSKVGTGIAAGNVTTGSLPANVMTNVLNGMFRSGVCTNGETISFVPAMAATPTVVGAYIGIPRNGDGTVVTNCHFYLDSVSVNSFKFESLEVVTNKIYFFAF